MRLNAVLWQTKLPAWDELDWYRLFLLHQAAAKGLGPPPTREEANLYALRCMEVVSLQFSKHRWLDSLPHVRLDPRDVAQDLLAHVIRKTPVFKLDAACEIPGTEWKMTIAQFNTAIRMRCATLVEDAKRRMQEAPTTDCIRREAEAQGSDLADRPVEAVARGSMPAVRLGDFLRAAEERICARVPGERTRFAEDAGGISRLYRMQCRRVTLGGPMLAYDELPGRLKSRVTALQHLDVTTNIRHAVSKAVENLTLN